MVSRHITNSKTRSWSWSPTKTLLALTALLTGLGLFFVFEASVAEAFVTFGDPYHFLKRQAIRAAIGSVALVIGYAIPVPWLRKATPWLYGLGILLLILVFVPGIRQEINGAHRWIFLGPFVFQPIEFVKLSLVLFFASWMSQHQRLAPFLFLTILPAALVMLQPDLGSTLVLLAIAFGLYFVAGGQIKPFIGVSTAGILVLALLIAISPYRRERVLTFLDPERDPLGTSFHIRQITLALANGGWFGQGIGNSRQKYSFIPEASTDSIFAIVAEEIGYVGSLVLISLFFWYILVGFNIVTKAQVPTFNKLVGLGIVLWIAAQMALNLAAVVALVPLTGVPLPFFSYGGSSLVMLLFATGILLKVTRDQKPS